MNKTKIINGCVVVVHDPAVHVILKKIFYKLSPPSKYVICTTKFDCESHFMSLKCKITVFVFKKLKAKYTVKLI